MILNTLLANEDYYSQFLKKKILSHIYSLEKYIHSFSKFENTECAQPLFIPAPICLVRAHYTIYELTFNFHIMSFPKGSII